MGISDLELVDAIRKGEIIAFQELYKRYADLMYRNILVRVNEVFEELPDACRKVYLRSLEGKSHQEISEELNIAINTIKKHKNNANHYLRVRLEKLLCFITWIG